jgi:hypothetical protein
MAIACPLCQVVKIKILGKVFKLYRVYLEIRPTNRPSLLGVFSNTFEKVRHIATTWSLAHPGFAEAPTLGK